jgi:hypothetical protein
MSGFVGWEQFNIAARSLAKRVWKGQTAYSEAETSLMQLRAGQTYERLHRAEMEASHALSAHIGVIERGHMGGYMLKPEL